METKPKIDGVYVIGLYANKENELFNASPEKAIEHIKSLPLTTDENLELLHIELIIKLTSTSKIEGRFNTKDEAIDFVELLRGEYK